MNDDVFRAILALDSYNRGYAPGLALIRNQPQLGTATLMGDSAYFGVSNGVRVDESYGFYASSYRWKDSSGTVHDVVSYRGTNPESPASLWPDIYYGWTVGAGDPGFAETSQAGLARQFLTAVLNRDAAIDPVTGLPEIVVPANVELVGHSLGGGLAGYAAAALGGHAYIFDHMPFGVAAWAQTIGKALDNAATATGVTIADALAVLSQPYNPVAVITGIVTAKTFLDSFVEELRLLKPDFSHITATNVEGEPLTLVRSGEVQVLAGSITAIIGTALGGNVLLLLLGAAGIADGLATSALEAQIPNKSELSLFGADIDSLSAHSMGLLAILEYADKQWMLDAKAMKVNANFWTLAAPDVLPAILDQGIAASIGLQ